MTTDILEIHSDELATATGGLFGPLDAIIGPVQAHDQHIQDCADAKHWEDNARKDPSPGVVAYAKYKRQFCPVSVWDPHSW